MNTVEDTRPWEGHRLLEDDILPGSGDQPARLGILISGSGSCSLAIAAAIRSGALPCCEIAVIVSNVTGAPGIDAARAAGLPVVIMEGRGREQRDHENAISTLLRTYRVDLVCMAGYLRVLSARFLREWRGRVLSIHPSLLPAFPGSHAAEQAIGYGVQYTGCTVHFVEEAMDTGAIVVQRIVAVEEDDTPESLAARIAAEEQVAYPEAVRRVLSGDYAMDGRRYLMREDLRFNFSREQESEIQQVVEEPTVSA